MTVCSGSLPLDLTASSSLAVSWAAPEGEVIEMKGPSKIVDSWDGTEYPQQVEFEFQAMIQGCTAPYQEITGSGVEFELDGIGTESTVEFTLNEESGVFLGTCDGCGDRCEVFVGVKLDLSAPSEEIDWKIAGARLSVDYDPSKVLSGKNTYTWATDGYMDSRTLRGFR